MPIDTPASRSVSVEAGFIDYRRTGSPVGLADALQGVRPELLRLALYQLRQRDAAEDVVQATLVTAIEQAQAFDPERRLIPWLCGILQNKISGHRRRQRRVFSDLDQEHLLAPSPHKEVEAKEAHALVGHALAQLPKHYRDVLDLHLNQGLGGCEIATRLQRPEGTIRAQIHRGLIRLRHLLPAGLAMGLLLVRRSSAQARGTSAQVASSLGTWLRLLFHSRMGIGALALSLGGLVFWLQAESKVPYIAAKSGADGPLAALPNQTDNPARRVLVLDTGQVGAAATAAAVFQASTLHGAGLPIRIIDQESGMPSGHAKLRALITDLDGRQHAFEQLGDAQGLLDLPFPPHRILELSCHAEGPDSSSARSRWDLSGTRFDAGIPLELRLIQTRQIGGFVLDEGSRPIAGAVLRLHLTTSVNNNQFMYVADHLSTRTASDGSWSISAAPEYPSRFQFSVFHRDYVPLLGNDLSGSVAAKKLWDGTARMHLRSGLRTTLRLTDLEGNLLADSHARLTERLDPPLFGIEMTPDKNGEYVFTTKAEEPFIVTAGAPGFGQDQKRFAPELSGECAVWAMEPKSKRRIRVVGPGGEGLAGALVRPFTMDWPEALSSDADGYVDLALRSAFWTLFQIQRPGTMGYINHLVRPGDEIIQMPAPVAFQLNVRDAISGMPLRDYVVTVYHPERWRRAQAMGPIATESQTIRFYPEPKWPRSMLIDRPLHVAVEHPGYEPFESGELSSKAFPGWINAELMPTRSLDISVLDPDGESALDTTMILLQKDQEAILVHGELSILSIERPLTQLLLRGKAKLTPPSGSFTLMMASEAGFAQVSDQALLALGEAPVIRLQAWACVEGNTQSNSMVLLCNADQGPGSLTMDYKNRPTPAGDFHFCNVPEGRVQLSIPDEKLSALVQVVAGVQVGPVVLRPLSDAQAAN